MVNSKSFSQYIKDMSQENFLVTLNSEYLEVKGKCTLHKPMFNVHVGIEFALALLLRNYIRPKLKNELNKYGPITINLADFMGLAFMGMSDAEWSERFNGMLMSYSDVIAYSDWFKAYEIVESNYLQDIMSMPFCYGNNIVAYASDIYENNRFYMQEFVPVYNSINGSFNRILNYFKNQGLRFDEITFPVAD